MADEQALIPAPVAAPAVAERPKDAIDKLRERYERLQTKDLNVADAMNRFAELPTAAEDPDDMKVLMLLAMSEEELKARGWKSKKELRMAAYARLPKRLWPASMQAAHERVGMRLRKQASASSKTVFNLAMISIPAPRRDPDARVVVVDVKEEKARR